MNRTLKYGMVGGGPDAFIGDAHRKAISIDNSADLVAGCFSRTLEKTKAQGEALRISSDRVLCKLQGDGRKGSCPGRWN